MHVQLQISFDEERFKPRPFVKQPVEEKGLCQSCGDRKIDPELEYYCSQACKKELERTGPWFPALLREGLQDPARGRAQGPAVHARAHEGKESMSDLREGFGGQACFLLHRMPGLQQVRRARLGAKTRRARKFHKMVYMPSLRIGREDRKAGPKARRPCSSYPTDNQSSGPHAQSHGCAKRRAAGFLCPLLRLRAHWG